MLLKKRQKELLNTPLFRKLPVEEATKTKEYAKKEEGGEKKNESPGKGDSKTTAAQPGPH